MAYLYDPKEVHVDLGGMTLMGFSPDNFLEIVPTSAIVKTVEGLDGRSSLSLSPAKSATCNITLQMMSESNLLLTALTQAQTLDPTNTALRLSLTISDASNSLLCSLSGCTIVELPVQSYSKSATGQSRVWSIFCERMELVTPDQPRKIESTLQRVGGFVTNLF